MADIEYISSEKMKKFPLSEAVRVGNSLYLSGQIGIDDSMKLVPGGIAEETQQTLENIKTVLAKCGASLENVVKVTIMLTDIRDWDEMNRIYSTYFQKNRPARSAFGVKGLALGARVEIECIAVHRRL